MIPPGRQEVVQGFQAVNLCTIHVWYQVPWYACGTYYAFFHFFFTYEVYVYDRIASFAA